MSVAYNETKETCRVFINNEEVEDGELSETNPQGTLFFNNLI